MSRLFNKHSDMIEVIIRDGGGMKMESRIANLSDDKSVNSLLYWLKNKWGVKMVQLETSFLAQEKKFLEV